MEMDNLHWELILLAIIVVVVVIGVIYYVWKKNYSNDSDDLKEGFMYNYSRVYPGIYSYERAYGEPFWPGKTWRFNPSYRDYWYIPSHEILDQQVNGFGGRQAGVDSYANAIRPINPNFIGFNQTDCMVPSHTSEYCVHQKIQETGNFNYAINSCLVPASVSESCIKPDL